MATPVSIANVARVAVGIVATIWALLGLVDAMAAATAHGVSGLVAAALAANAALLGGAVMAFANLQNWRAVVIAATGAVTAQRFLYVAGTGDFLLAISSVVMLLAIVGIASVARRAV